MADFDAIIRLEGNPAPDPTPPVVAVVSPTVGTTIGFATPLVVNVTDNLSSFRRIVVVVQFPGLRITELAYDGEAFTTAYEGTSAVVAIANGFQFTLRRNAAWPDSPTVRVYAIDTAGNEAL